MKRSRPETTSLLEGANLDLYCLLSLSVETMLVTAFKANNLKDNKPLQRKLVIYPDPTLSTKEVNVVRECMLFICPIQYRLLSNVSDTVLQHRVESYKPFQCAFLDGVAKFEFQHVRLRPKEDHIEWTLDILKYEFSDACYYGRSHCYEPKGDNRQFGKCTGALCRRCRRIYDCDVHSKRQEGVEIICKGDHRYCPL